MGSLRGTGRVAWGDKYFDRSKIRGLGSTEERKEKGCSREEGQTISLPLLLSSSTCSRYISSLSCFWLQIVTVHLVSSQPHSLSEIILFTLPEVSVLHYFYQTKLFSWPPLTTPMTNDGRFPMSRNSCWLGGWWFKTVLLGVMAGASCSFWHF